MGFLTFGGRGFRLGLLVSMVVLDGYGIHIRGRMNAHWYNRDGYPASIVFMISCGSTTGSQHSDTLWIRHSHSQQSARAFNRDGYPASVVFMKHYLRLLVSMAVLHVTFTVAAECAGSTEIPGVQWYSCHG